MDDIDNIAAAQRGERGAREVLMDAWLPVVLGWCVRLGGPSVDPEDAAHDVMIIVITRLDRLQNLESFRSWLFGITRRVLASHRRRAWVRRWVPGAEIVDAPDPGPAPDDQHALSELSRGVQRAVDKLPALQREVLVLCDVEEYTDEEVAALLGIPVGTVKSRLRLARKKFRRAAQRMNLVAPALSAATGGG